ncbi:ABC transporter permease [Carbonactinospora thermoautotrophica]|uniref:ABC transporter permease n=1 Tax=Carbonactinospora thermoautotrophica TaxID=1469144 RepID=A0A132NHF9_9ACTN|nr:ABC transporter permease [Carbonactinospora thermoautotrophica]KWX05485.1 ABC transporter permease [Carbonactinospora thermoautotrophica]KWX09407.1 ABC transporter permease [Carbonactinospora thermoautotrophica]
MTALTHLGTGSGGGSSTAPPATEPQRSLTPYLLLAPGLLWLLVFFAVPMVFLVSQSLQTGSVEEGYRVTWHWQTYLDALGAYHVQFLRSLGYAAAATLLGLVIGYPLAYTIAFRAGRWKNLLLVTVIAPFFTSFLIRTLAWQTILTNDGPVVTFFRETGLLTLLRMVHLVPGDQLMNSPFAVITGLTYNFLPFMVLPLYASLEKIDHRLLEAAGDLYASPWTAFRKVTWPLSLPGVVAGTLLTFIPATGDYINSKLLGSPQTTMIGQVIDAQFLRVLDYPVAAALSVTLMVTIAVLVSLYVRRAGTEELV